MQQKIKVLKSEKSDSIILTNKNPEFSSILVGCDTFGIAPTGFATIDKRRAFYTGRTEIIEQLVQEYNLVEGSEFPIEGKILIIESLEPQYEGHEPKKNPNNGELMTQDGALIYRNQIFVSLDDKRTDNKLLADSTSLNSKIKSLSETAEKVFNN